MNWFFVHKAKRQATFATRVFRVPLYDFTTYQRGFQLGYYQTISKTFIISM